MGTELVQRPNLASTESPEVTAKPSSLENPPSDLTATREERNRALQDECTYRLECPERWPRMRLTHPAKDSVRPLLKEGKGKENSPHREVVTAAQQRSLGGAHRWCSASL